MQRSQKPSPTRPRSHPALPEFRPPPVERAIRPVLWSQLPTSAWFRAWSQAWSQACLVPWCLTWSLALSLMLTGGIACTSLQGGSGPALRVGISPDFPPVAFENEGEIVGIEPDLAAIMAQSLGRRLQLTRYAFTDLLPALERGEIDVVMSGMSITPERQERVRFTEPYMEAGQLTLIRSADIARFGRIQTVRRVGARVGYERGTSGEEFVARRLPRASSFGFDDVDSGIRSLRANRIDYFVHDAPTIWRMAGDPNHRDLHGLYKPLTREYLAWAVHPQDQQLLSDLNTSLARWKREGMIEPIVDRWIPVRIRIP